jgi:hypothetical protein
LILVAAVLLLARVGMAQLSTATILGVVRDATGAVVPGASLSATNLETGFTRTAQSASDGSYRFAALPVGRYDVRAEHAGFQSQAQTGLRISVGEEVVLNFTIQVGAVTESVSVTAEAPIVNTTSGTLSSLVSQERISETSSGRAPWTGRNSAPAALPSAPIRSCSTAPS